MQYYPIESQESYYNNSTDNNPPQNIPTHPLENEVFHNRISDVAFNKIPMHSNGMNLHTPESALIHPKMTDLQTYYGCPSSFPLVSNPHDTPLHTLKPIEERVPLAEHSVKDFMKYYMDITDHGATQSNRAQDLHQPDVRTSINSPLNQKSPINEKNNGNAEIRDFPQDLRFIQEPTPKTILNPWSNKTNHIMRRMFQPLSKKPLHHLIGKFLVDNSLLDDTVDDILTELKDKSLTQAAKLTPLHVLRIKKEIATAKSRGYVNKIMESEAEFIEIFKFRLLNLPSCEKTFDVAAECLNALQSLINSFSTIKSVAEEIKRHANIKNLKEASPRDIYLSIDIMAKQIALTENDDELPDIDQNKALHIVVEELHRLNKLVPMTETKL